MAGGARRRHRGGRRERAHDGLARRAVRLVPLGRDDGPGRPGARASGRSPSARWCRYADQRSAQLQTAVDDLVQQDRLVPGQLAAAAAADGRGRRCSCPPTASAAAAARSTRRRGSRARSRAPGCGADAALRPGAAPFTPTRAAAARPCCAARAAALRGSRTPPGRVRVEPGRRATVLEGDADGVAALAGARRARPRRARCFYARRRERRRSCGELVARRRAARVHRQRAPARRRDLAHARQPRPDAAGPATDPAGPRRATTPFRRGCAGRRDGGASTPRSRALYAPALPGVQPVPRAPRVRRLRRPPRHHVAGRPRTCQPRDRYVEATLREPLRGRPIEVVPARRPARRDDARRGAFNGGDEREFAV